MMKKILALVLCATTASAYTPTNFDQPYDATFSEQSWRYGTGLMHVGVRGEFLTEVRAFDPDEHKVTAPNMWGQTQSTLAMLEGHASGTSLHALSNRLRGAQDGTRGTFTVDGSFDRRQAIVDFCLPLSMIKLPGLFTLGVHVPLIESSFSKITWKSKTKQQTLHDDVVITSLANDQDSLASFVKTHGGLDIGDQSRRGVGDVAVMLNWQGHFSQYQRRLQDVRVQARVGLSVPTGHEPDKNKAFDIDFGHDGTLGVPVGAGLRLDLGGGFRVGLDVGGMILMRRTKEWRLKKSWEQTQHLLLSTGKATREYGPEWKFMLYSQLYHNVSGITLTGAYQFLKHTDSTLFSQSDVFSSSLINLAEDVEASESHNLVGNFTYSPAMLRGWRVRPELMLTVKWPFLGRRVASGTTVGGGLSVRF